MYKLRERQETLLKKLSEDIKNHESILLIAPTGSGKTVMLSSFMKGLVDQNPDCKILCLVHRQEISNQNLETALKFDLKCQIFLGKERELKNNTNVIFSMQITAFRELDQNNNVFGKIDYLIVDEAHHINSYSYRNILSILQDNNKDLKAIGWTATPLRGDRELISDHFKHLTDQIFLRELIETGYLVPPKIFIPKGSRERSVCPEEFFKLFEEHVKIDRCHYRPTVAFLPSLEDCEYFTSYFCDEGIRAAYIDGKMPSNMRKDILNQYACGEIQIIFNFGILIEGWNEPYTSCVMIARRKSHSTVILQMIGRGLRTLNGSEIEHINPYAKHKKDCLVIDYYGSTRKLQSLEQFLPLEDKFVGKNPYEDRGDGNGDGNGDGENGSLDDRIEEELSNSQIHYDTLTLSGTKYKATYTSIDKTNALIISRPVRKSKNSTPPESILFVTTKEDNFRIAFIGSFKIAKKIADDFVKSTARKNFLQTQKQWGAKENFSKSRYTLKNYIIKLPIKKFRQAWYASAQRQEPFTANTACFFVTISRLKFDFSFSIIENIFNSKEN